MKKNIGLFLLTVSIVLSSICLVQANSFKKNRIKQLSQHSERYNYYEERNNRVVEGSKEIDPLAEDKGLGLDARELNGYGKTQNWVEIQNSEVGVDESHGVKSINRFKNEKKDSSSDTNLGIIADCNNNLDSTVIVKNSKVKGAKFNTGISINNCNGKIRRKKYTNDVTIDNSRVGGTSGLL